MKQPKLFVENGKTAPEIMIDVLFEKNMISESAYRKATALELLFEASNTHKTIYYKDRAISRDLFASVYSNIDHYETNESIAAALKLEASLFGDDDRKRKQNLDKAINRMVDNFNSTASVGDEIFPKPSRRFRHYSKPRDDNFSFDETSIDDIDGGSRNRSDRATKTVERINSQDLLDGEFYANMTRIPKSRWGSWLRFWNRKKTSIAQDKSFFGRVWKKSFILGYQVEPRVLYEIWYNSIDSTFTVHDVGGAEMSPRAKTMTEAIRNLVNMLAQTSTSDAEIFRGSNRDAKQIAQSITQALHRDMDLRAKELEEIDNKKQKERRAQRIKDIGERRKAERIASSNWRLFKSSFDEDPTTVGEDPTKSKVNDGQSDQKVKVNRDRNDNSQAALRRRADELAKRLEREKAELEKAEKEAEMQRWREEISDNIPSTRNDPYEKMMDNIPSLSASYKADRAKRERDKKRAQARTNRQRGTTTKEEAAKRVRAKIEQTKKEIARLSESISIMESLEEDDMWDQEIHDHINERTYDSQIRDIKKMAEISPYTQNALKQTVMGELVRTYSDNTKSKKSTFGNVIRNWIDRGRREKVVSPQDTVSLIARPFGDILRGYRYRADFIIGWSLANKVNIEIWYITEPHPEDRKRIMASFYVFDINSKTVVRRYLPYYRNAVQVVISKIGTF